MDRTRRSAALVMGILMLQLSLAGGLSQCDEPAVSAESAHAGMPMPAESESCSSDAVGSDCTQSDHGACQAAMSCLVAVFQPSAQSQLPVTLAHEAAAVGPATLFQTRNAVPDLPPPRV